MFDPEKHHASCDWRDEDLMWHCGQCGLDTPVEPGDIGFAVAVLGGSDPSKLFEPDIVGPFASREEADFVADEIAGDPQYQAEVIVLHDYRSYTDR